MSGKTVIYRVYGHVFTMNDVARVRKGIDRARCRTCTPYSRAYAINGNRAARPPKVDCGECRKTRERLGILKEHLEKEGLL